MLQDFISLLKVAPAPIQWVLWPLIIIVLAVFSLTAAHRFYVRVDSHRRSRKKDDHAELTALIANSKEKSPLQAVSEELLSEEIFYKQMQLNASKQQRDLLVELFMMGFLQPKALRMLSFHLKRADSGKFDVQVGLTEFFLVGGMFIGICAIGLLMIIMDFLTTPAEATLRVATLFVGGFMILSLAGMARPDAMTIRHAVKTTHELAKRGLLEGVPGFKAQWKEAWKRGRILFYTTSAILLSLLVAGWSVAALLRYLVEHP